MPRFPKPFFRSNRGWFVQVGKSQIKLCDGPKNADTEAVALRKYHQLMAERAKPKPANSATSLPNDDEPSVAEVLDKFLDWCQKHREPRTYEWYKDHIQNFVTHFKKTENTPASALKPFHVLEWVDAQEGWGDAVRRGATIAVQRPFNWAEKVGYIDRSPIRNVEKPKATRRERFITPEEWVKIRDHYPVGDPFRLLLEFSWESGCRPQEARAVEVRHVLLEKKCLAFPPAEAKGKKRWRIIHLTPRAEEIIRGLMAGKTEGLLFLNAAGTPWNRWNMSCRFGRLKKSLGALYCSYLLRHGFCQKLLEGGADHLTVAALMGHTDGQMISKVYSHLNQSDEHLKKALNSDVDVAKPG